MWRNTNNKLTVRYIFVLEARKNNGMCMWNIALLLFTPYIINVIFSLEDKVTAVILKLRIAILLCSQ